MRLEQVNTCSVLRTSWHSPDLCLPLLGLFTPQKEFGLFTLSQTVTQTHSPRGTGYMCVYMYTWLYAAMSEHLPIERIAWPSFSQGEVSGVPPDGEVD